MTSNGRRWKAPFWCVGSVPGGAGAGLLPHQVDPWKIEALQREITWTVWKASMCST